MYSKIQLQLFCRPGESYLQLMQVQSFYLQEQRIFSESSEKIWNEEWLQRKNNDGDSPIRDDGDEAEGNIK